MNKKDTIAHHAALLADTIGHEEAVRLIAYEVRRARAAAEFGRMFHGSQKMAADELGLSASTVSSVLSGTYRREEVLAQLEDWLSRNA